jgi:DNA-binding NarL/FixJ family response regulator
VVLAARVRLYREGLRDALERNQAFVVLAECATVEELLRVASRDPPEVVILDMSFCDKRPVARELLAVAPATKILALAVDDRQAESVLDCAAAGMAGWVGTDATVEELARAVEHVARGELMCSARHAALLFGRVADLLTHGAPETAAPVPLTAREREVGVLLARGLSNKGISRSLGIGIATVKDHVHNILGKLEVSSRAEAGCRLVQTLSSELSAPIRKDLHLDRLSR